MPKQGISSNQPMNQYKRLFSLTIILACILLVINFGLRASMGFFMKPVSEYYGYGREIFALSLALQNLFWGLSQPIAGAIADRYGTARTIVGGALLYSLGLYITANAQSIWELHMGAGIFLGMGIAGTGFGVVLPAMPRPKKIPAPRCSSQMLCAVALVDKPRESSKAPPKIILTVP